MLIPVRSVTLCSSSTFSCHVVALHHMAPGTCGGWGHMAQGTKHVGPGLEHTSLGGPGCRVMDAGHVSDGTVKGVQRPRHQTLDVRGCGCNLGGV